VAFALKSLSQKRLTEIPPEGTSLALLPGKPREDFSMTAGRTIGAAIGLALFVIFFATIAGRLANPVSAAEPNSAAVSAR
jgi:hypothetical protein